MEVKLIHFKFLHGMIKSKYQDHTIGLHCNSISQLTNAMGLILYCLILLCCFDLIKAVLFINHAQQLTTMHSSIQLFLHKRAFPAKVLYLRNTLQVWCFGMHGTYIMNAIHKRTLQVRFPIHFQQKMAHLNQAVILKFTNASGSMLLKMQQYPKRSLILSWQHNNQIVVFGKKT